MVLENLDHRYHLKARLMVLPTEVGGRSHPVQDGYRVDWALHNDNTLNGGMARVSEVIELGLVGDVKIFPMYKDFWKSVKVGQQLRMQEGQHIVGIAKVLEIVDGR